MSWTAKVRTAQTPLPAAMAIALATTLLPLAAWGSEAAAQNRGNVQAEQSQALRNRAAPSRSVPSSGRYVADSGDAFILDMSGSRPLLRFERREETWVLRPSAAPRGDVIYRNDTGQQVLRVTADGGLTVYTNRAQGGSPASLAGPGASLAQPTLGPAQLLNLMGRRGVMLQQSLGRRIEINIDTDEHAEALSVEALILSTDAILRIARSPTARGSLDRFYRIDIVKGSRPAVTYARGRLTIAVAPEQGTAGRPSSARIIRAVLPQN